MKFRTFLFVACSLALRCPAAEILKLPDMDLSVGGRFQSTGELENVTDEPLRAKTRVYLFNTQERLFARGQFKGTRFRFEEALGSEAINTSNNQVNLLEFNAQVPLNQDWSVMVGQFKVPAGLESSAYDGNLAFAGKSLLMQLFFNSGYDTGAVLRGKAGTFDGLLGTISGAPDIPQRYLPELFKFPPMLVGRLGYSDGIDDDPYAPLQTGFAVPERLQHAVHLSGIYANDSNAGHSTLLALQSSYFAGFSANSYYSNALLSTAWNPYLGKTAANFGQVTAAYWQAGLDGVLRLPWRGAVLSMQAQASFARFAAGDFAPFAMNGVTVTSGSLEVAGGLVQASLDKGPFTLGARVVAVVPDAGFVNKDSGGKFNAITGTLPIYEVTFPALTWRVSEHVRLSGEAMFLLNSPEAFGDDGVYELLEMPSQVTNVTAASPAVRNAFVPIGHMAFIFDF